MLRKSFVILGWLFIVAAVVFGLLGVPVIGARGSGSNGSMTVTTSPFGTQIAGNGQFTYESTWSISWPMLAISGLVLAIGVLLIWPPESLARLCRSLVSRFAHLLYPFD